MQITDKDLQKFRERAKTELQSNGTVGRLAWDTIVNALCNEVEELRKNAVPGNSAAMREALEYAREVLALNGFVEPVVRCDAALGAPVRNCDRFATAEEAYAAWQKHNSLTAICDRPFDPAEGGEE